MSERITKAQLAGMLSRATVAGREAGAISYEQKLIEFVPWSHGVIAVCNNDGSGGVRPITERGGSMRELYNEAHTLAVAWELVCYSAVERGRVLRGGVS